MAEPQNNLFIGKHLVSVDITASRFWQVEHMPISGRSHYTFREREFLEMIRGRAHVVLGLPFQMNYDVYNVDVILDVLVGEGFRIDQVVVASQGFWSKQFYLSRRH